MEPRLLNLGLACVDVAMAAVSWLILLCTYPDFARWQAADFTRHHEDYTRKVGRIVGPLLLLQLGGHLWLATGGASLGVARRGAGVLGPDGFLVRPLPSSPPARGAGFTSARQPDPLACLADGPLDARGYGIHLAGGGLTACVAR